MRIASLVMLLVAGMMTGVGMIPCFGWLQWFAVPMSTATVIVGFVGLATDRGVKARSDALPAHLAAVVGGLMLIGFGTLRCLLGLGAV